jgi:hypothetical protein
MSVMITRSPNDETFMSLLNSPNPTLKCAYKKVSKLEIQKKRYLVISYSRKLSRFFLVQGV